MYVVCNISNDLNISTLCSIHNITLHGAQLHREC